MSSNQYGTQSSIVVTDSYAAESQSTEDTPEGAKEGMYSYDSNLSAKF